MERRRTRRWWIWLGVVVAGVALGWVTNDATAYAKRHLPSYVAHQLSEALGRPVSLGRVSLWPLGSFSLRHLRVLPGPNETRPPLTAERIRVYVAWWDLLAHRRLRVTELHVDGAHLVGEVDLRKPMAAQPDVTRELLALSRFGLSRIGIHRSAVEVTTIARTGEREVLTARGVDAVTRIGADRLQYRVGAKNWAGAGFAAQDVHIDGRADARTLTISKSRARFHGGTLAANGTYVTDRGDVAMHVQVRDLPLSGLAPQIGIPREWAVQGRVTGIVDVAAASGDLRRIHGTLRAARGSITRAEGAFPWNSATARVDWHPASVALTDIAVQGPGLKLTGAGYVDGPETLPLPQRPFRARGTVEATGTNAAARLAALLAFSTPVKGQWGLDRATVSFRARGTVGRLEAARADGHFHAEGLMLHPPSQPKPLIIRTVDADLDRWPDHLHLHRVRAAADGMTASGRLTIHPAQGRRAGRFDTDVQLDVTSLVALRQQLPSLMVWQWIDSAAPGSSGRIDFAGGGLFGTAESTAGTGAFQFRSLAARVPTGRGEERWTAPVHELTGRLALRDNRLALQNVALRSELFTAGGNGVVEDVANGGQLAGSFRLTSSRWAHLPPLQGRIPREISGGTLILRAQLPKNRRSGSKTVSGTMTLAGATYRGVAQGRERTVPVQVADARFTATPERVTVPAYRVITPLFRTSGSGYGTPAAGTGTSAAWAVHGSGVLSTADAGKLLQWASGEDSLAGGRLDARYSLELVLNSARRAPDRTSITARVRLVDALPRLPAGTLPFPAQESRIRSLTGTFSHRNGVTRFADAVWEAPRFRVAGDGVFDGRILDGKVRLTTSDWGPLAGDLMRTLPVSGGTLTVTGHLRGPVDRLRHTPIDGTVALRDALITSRPGSSFPVKGGRLDLNANVRGTLTRLVTSDLDGSFAVRDLKLSSLRAGAEAIIISTARGRFDRSGTRVRLTDVVARSQYARLTGHGEIEGAGTRSSSHRLALSIRGSAVTNLLSAFVAVPGKASGGRFSGTLTLAGTSARPITKMEGRAEVHDTNWTPPRHTVAIPISRMSAHFVRTGSDAVLDDVELRTPGGEVSLTGTVRGLDSPTTTRQNLRLSWKLEDASGWASRFLPVPGRFTGGSFTGKATLDGTPRDPTQRTSGTFEVRDAGFMPPKPVLGGPVRPIQVAWAKGIFSRANRRTELKDLDLNTSLGIATGRVVSDDRGVADIRANVDVRQLGVLVDHWPVFDGRIRGGSGKIELALRGPLRQPRDLAGTIDLVGRGGILTVENVDELYATQPFDELSTRLLLGDGKVRLQQVKMRGPKANLDGEGVVTADGRVQGKGKGWLTEQFTKKLVRPRILWPVAKLVGYKRLKSDFTVKGSLKDARLQMGITKSLAWKLAIKKRVPEHLRKIATGEAPIWSGDGIPEVPGAARKPRLAGNDRGRTDSE